MAGYKPQERSQSTGQGAAGGAVSGAATGAMIGTAVLPGIGTGVGALIGAGAGALLGAGVGSSMGLGAKKKRHAQEQAEQEMREEMARRAAMVQRVRTIYGEGDSTAAQTNRALFRGNIEQEVAAGRDAALGENMLATGESLSGVNALAARTGNFNPMDKSGVIAGYGMGRAKVAQAAGANRASAWSALAARRRSMENEVASGASLNPQFDAMQVAADMQGEQSSIWPNFALSAANQGVKYVNMVSQADAMGYSNGMLGGRQSNKTGVQGARVTG